MALFPRPCFREPRGLAGLGGRGEVRPLPHCATGPRGGCALCSSPLRAPSECSVGCSDHLSSSLMRLCFLCGHIQLCKQFLQRTFSSKNQNLNGIK